MCFRSKAHIPWSDTDEILWLMTTLGMERGHDLRSQNGFRTALTSTIYNFTYTNVSSDTHNFLKIEKKKLNSLYENKLSVEIAVEISMLDVLLKFKETQHFDDKFLDFRNVSKVRRLAM